MSKNYLQTVVSSSNKVFAPSYLCSRESWNWIFRTISNKIETPEPIWIIIVNAGCHIYMNFATDTKHCSYWIALFAKPLTLAVTDCQLSAAESSRRTLPKFQERAGLHLHFLYRWKVCTRLTVVTNLIQRLHCYFTRKIWKTPTGQSCSYQCYYEANATDRYLPVMINLQCWKI